MLEKKFTVYDTSPTRCQCVMRHIDMKENALAQCGDKRVSNLFCRGCEDLHGDYWRAKHPESAKA